MSQVATGSFIGDALDKRSPRPFRISTAEYLAIVFRNNLPVAGADASDIETWKADGLKILAVRQDAGKILSPREFSGGLAQGDSAVIAGPEVNVRLYLMFEGFDLD